MKKFIIELTKGFGPIKLGMDKSELDNILGECSHSLNNTYYYLNNSLSIEMNSKNKICFIQFSNDPDLEIIIDKLNLFNLKDTEIQSHLNQYGKIDKNDHEYPYVYSYPRLQIIFWRAVEPSSLEHDMKNDLSGVHESTDDYQEITQFYYL